MEQKMMWGVCTVFIVATLTSAIVYASSETNSYEEPNAEMYWNHMPLTYTTENCDTAMIEKSLTYITQKTGNAVRFEKVNDNADISYVCLPQKDAQYEQQGLMSSVGGTTLIGYSKETSTVTTADIKLYESEGWCDNEESLMTIHETLHALGIKHNESYLGFTDVMNPYIGIYCGADISQEDVDYLKKTYTD